MAGAGTDVQTGAGDASSQYPVTEYRVHGHGGAVRYQVEPPDRAKVTARGAVVRQATDR